MLTGLNFFARRVHKARLPHCQKAATRRAGSQAESMPFQRSLNTSETTFREKEYGLIPAATALSLRLAEMKGDMSVDAAGLG